MGVVLSCTGPHAGLLVLCKVNVTRSMKGKLLRTAGIRAHASGKL